jgi:N,N-dimethylformamidase beta subunit-like protein
MEPGIIGYCDPWSARPGQALSFMISSAGDRPFRTRVVRVRHADPNPAGPGMKLIPVSEFGEQVHAGREQSARPGSFGSARCPDIPEGPFHIIVNFRCLKNFPRTECLLSLQDESGQRFLMICIADGEIILGLSDGGEATSIATGIRIEPAAWWSLGLTVNAKRGAADLELVELRPRSSPIRRAHRTVTFPGSRLQTNAWTLAVMGAALKQEAQTYCFNGQLEAPSVSTGELSDLQAIGGGLGVEAGGTLAAWDFSADIMSQTFRDHGPAGLHGTLFNLPTRAMRGSNWSGREMCWRHSPGEYGVVHFHDDDVGDLGWEESCSLRIPETTASGVYALHVENELGFDQIPFYVLPHPERRSGARIVFLASTMTYLAYANHTRANWSGALQARAQAWGAYPNNPDVVRDLGFSTYNYHPDGSGIALSSRRRPVLSMRPGYLTYEDRNGSGLRHFPADSHLLDWLEEKGFAFDVVTDEDLDDHGVDLIRDYAVVITGSHPEYHTEAMLNALEQYRAGGGNLCYMGGNGFYWRIARPKALPWAMEIRRAESGIRAWACEPGEYYNQLDGAYGGLWRRNGRPPQALAEIGFAVQGLFEGSYYRRTAASADPAVAWMFAGVEGEILGDYGLSGGGAAGFELDQVSEHLGTSKNAIVVARSEGHGPSFLGVPEDVLTHTLAVGGRVEIEAHMAYGCNDAGGEVFSTGSITFIGSLSHNAYDNSISRIVENVLRRFSARKLD